MDDAWAEFQYGAALGQRRRFREAEKRLRNAIKLDPSLKEAYNDLGIVLTLQDLPFEAIPILRRAIGIDPDYIDARYNLATAYLNNDMAVQAITEYSEILVHQPNATDAMNQLAVALIQRGRRPEATEILSRLLALEPSHLQGRSNLNFLAADSHRLENLVVQLQVQVTNSTRDALACHDLAVALHDLGRWSEAEERYRTALRLDPSRVNTRNNLATLIADSGRAEEAAHEYSGALNSDPKYIPARRNLALLLESIGEYRTAACHWREVRKRYWRPSIRRKLARRIDYLETADDVSRPPASF